MSDTIKLLADLIEIDSVNPSLVPGASGEGEIATAVADYLRSSKLDVVITEVEPGRQNVVGLLEGSQEGLSLILCGHTDTVGVEGMESPFTPVQKDGKMFGRGSGDMKGGLAAILDAARALAQQGWSKGNLIVAAVVDEEYTSAGAEALVKDWRADAAIVAEPTGLAVAVGHKGFSWVEITVKGRAAHGSRPQEGRDAILRMGRVMQRLEELSRRLQTSKRHELLGTASLHASTIHGGREMSTYPDRCVLNIERRNLSGEKTNVALEEVESIIADLARDDPDFQAQARALFDRPPYETPSDSSLPGRLESAIKAAGHETRLEGMTYWTDAAILGSVGIPSVIFGPGGEGFHGLEEFVFVDHVLACRDVLTSFAREFCEGTK